MTVDTAERQTVIHIHIGEDASTEQKSYAHKEMLRECRLSNTSHFEKTQDVKTGDFWKADNYGVKGEHPRYHHEHVEYMIAVVNGIMSTAVALDLWNLRKEMIRDELTSRALSLPAQGKKVKRK